MWPHSSLTQFLCAFPWLLLFAPNQIALVSGHDGQKEHIKCFSWFSLLLLWADYLNFSADWRRLLYINKQLCCVCSSGKVLIIFVCNISQSLWCHPVISDMPGKAWLCWTLTVWGVCDHMAITLTSGFWKSRQTRDEIQDPKTHLGYQCVITRFGVVTRGHPVTEPMETLSTLAKNP